MKALAKRIYSDKFFSATFWVFLGTGFVNFGNYLYHLLMGRMLDVPSYGALQSIISILYILVVPTMTMTFVLVKFVSSHKGKGEADQIQSLYSYVFTKILLYGGLVLLVLLALSPLIQNFLHLASLNLVLFLPIAFFLNMFFFLNKSVLQGMSSFVKFGMVNMVEPAIKIPAAIILVYLGYSVLGAVGAILASIIVGVVISHLLVQKLLSLKINLKASYSHRKELIKFALPTFITILGLTSLFTADVILVRHFFPGVESGYYSALSVLGKVIHFATIPLIFVLFPMVSESHAKGAEYKKILIRAVIACIVIGLSIVGLYYLVPNIMVGLLFGEKYLTIVPLLWIFGVFVALHSLCYLLANFYLSIHQTKPAIFVILAALMQIVLIIIFKDSLVQIIFVSIAVLLLLLISLLLYYPHAKNGA